MRIVFGGQAGVGSWRDVPRGCYCAQRRCGGARRDRCAGARSGIQRRRGGGAAAAGGRNALREDKCLFGWAS
jgi:hypothetical protein